MNYTESTVAKLFIKNFHEKWTKTDIANAILGVDIGNVLRVHIRTSRRNIHHAVVEIIWKDTEKSNSQFLRGLLKTGNTVRISVNPNYPDSYLEIVEYREEIDTKNHSHYQSKAAILHHHHHHHTRNGFGSEFGSEFEQYGEKMLRTIGIH